MSENRVIITDESSGKSLELPVIRGVEGEPTLHIKATGPLTRIVEGPALSGPARCVTPR